MKKSGAMNESQIQQLRAAVLQDLNELIPKNHYTFVRTQQDIAGQDFLLAKLLISSHYRNPQLSSRQLTAASLLEKIGLYCSEYKSPDLKSDVDAGIKPKYIKQQEQENLCTAIEEYRIHLPKKEAKILTRFLIPATAPAAEVKAEALPVEKSDADYDQELVELFDPMPVESLEQMFLAGGKWKDWAERAKRNGLIDARVGRGKFNPYLAGKWFVCKGKVSGWSNDRLFRKLKENLPARSRNEAHLLGGDLD